MTAIEHDDDVMCVRSIFVHFALSSPTPPHLGLDERAFPSMSHDRERERGGDDGYDNVQQNYYQRSWGDHPDLRSLDGRSQASEGQGQGEITHHSLVTLHSIPLHYILYNFFAHAAFVHVLRPLPSKRHCS